MADLAWLVPAVQFTSRPPPSRFTPHPAGNLRHHRTIFISDLHLGTRGCKAELLADFLSRNSSRTLYLVGDIVDGWQLKHGDQFDGVINFARWLAHLGSWAYERALQLNELLHRVRHLLGFPYWSLSAWLKHAVKDAVEYVCRFEDAVAQVALLRGLDGVVCGHIHQAQIRRIGGVLYLNDGDWVESCTALVEDARGHLEIVRWAACLSTPAYSSTVREAAPLPA